VVGIVTVGFLKKLLKPIARNSLSSTAIQKEGREKKRKLRKVMV